MTYTLFTANRNYSSWSLRPWLLMKALDIPFEDRMETFEVENYSRFRAFSPTGTVPALHDGDTQVWDSLGIALYLADRHEGVWPADPAARAFAQSAVAEMHSGFSALRNACTMNVGVRVEVQGASLALAKDVARIAELWAEGLARFGGPFLGGPQFSVLDAFFAPVAFRVRTYALDVGAAGHTWVDHILAHPACASGKRRLWPSHGAKKRTKPILPPVAGSPPIFGRYRKHYEPDPHLPPLTIGRMGLEEGHYEQAPNPL